MEAIEELVEVARDPHRRLTEISDGGRHVVGYVCSYVPEELIHAAGLLPVRLILGSEPGETAGRFMQNFCCSFARSILEGLGDGTCDYLSAVVMPHTCDTVRNMSDLVGPARPGTTVINLMVPTVTHTPEALDFMVEELESLKGALEELTSRAVSDSDLRDSIVLFNRCRSAADGLRGAGLAEAELYSAYLAFQTMDKERFLELAESIELREEVTGGTGVALVGGPVPGTAYFELLSEHGLRVLWDDLCTATRHLAGPVGESGDPLRALAERYLARIPCPTKSDPKKRREEAIVDGVRSSGASGVIFLVQNFCEFHAFDYPALKDRLDAEGIPSLKLELEYPFRPTGREATRVQAFAETLEGGA